MKIASIVILFVCLFNKTTAQEVESMSIKKLTSQIIQKNDTLYVVNFWATWCKPCIEELPHFEKCNEEFKNMPVKIVLVNLDFNAQVEKSVKPFMKKKNIRSKVIHVTDTDPNEWINTIENSWSGAIPATIVYRNSQKLFFKEGTMTYKELSKTINDNKNKSE